MAAGDRTPVTGRWATGRTICASLRNAVPSSPRNGKNDDRYRLHLHSSVYDYESTAILVESEIKRLGIRHDSKGYIPSMKSRRYVDAWLSIKAVSHFNLGTSPELMLKIIMVNTGEDIQHTHTLVSLYDSLPTEWEEKPHWPIQASGRAASLESDIDLPFRHYGDARGT